MFVHGPHCTAGRQTKKRFDICKPRVESQKEKNDKLAKKRETFIPPCPCKLHKESEKCHYKSYLLTARLLPARECMQCGASQCPTNKATYLPLVSLCHPMYPVTDYVWKRFLPPIKPQTSWTSWPRSLFKRNLFTM